MESNEKNFLLLLDHDGQFPFFFTHMFSHLLIFWCSFLTFHFFHFCLEFLDSENVALDLMLNDPHCGITNLIGTKNFMELSEVRISLEYVQ